MVFSAENNSSNNEIASSRYGSFITNIQLVPLVPDTDYRNEIAINVDIEIHNCTSNLLNLMLSNLRSELITKADSFLAPFGAYGPAEPVQGYGSFSVSIIQIPLFANTTDPTEIAFNVRAIITNTIRSKLDAVLDGLQAEIVDKMNELI